MDIAEIFEPPAMSFIKLNLTRLLVFGPEMAAGSDAQSNDDEDEIGGVNDGGTEVLHRFPSWNRSTDDVTGDVPQDSDVDGNYSDYPAGLGFQLDPWDIEFQRIINVLHVYVLPVIILIGIVGNTLSFFVYIGTPRLYRQSSSLYLAFLAAVDNISLIFIFVVWFGMVGVHLLHKNGWCQTVMYCTYVCSFLSAWTVVSFTCERWIVVFHPLKRHRLCTRRRAIVVMTSLTVGSMAFYSFSLFSQGVRYASNGVSDLPVCVTLPQYNSSLRVSHVTSVRVVSVV
jgi:7 transmembrane receptor (rhodopsin family)